MNASRFVDIMLKQQITARANPRSYRRKVLLLAFAAYAVLIAVLLANIAISLAIVVMIISVSSYFSLAMGIVFLLMIYRKIIRNIKNVSGSRLL